jgi:hypothetical protein
LVLAAAATRFLFLEDAKANLMLSAVDRHVVARRSLLFELCRGMLLTLLVIILAL